MKRPFFVDLVREVVGTFADRSSHSITTEESQDDSILKADLVLILRCSGRTLHLKPSGELDMVWYETCRPTGDLDRNGLPMMRMVSSGVHTTEQLWALLEWVEGRPGNLLADVLT